MIGGAIYYGNGAFVYGLTKVKRTSNKPEFGFINIERDVPNLINYHAVPCFEAFTWNSSLNAKDSGMPKQFYCLTFTLAFKRILQKEQQLYEQCKSQGKSWADYKRENDCAFQNPTGLYFGCV